MSSLSKADLRRQIAKRISELPLERRRELDQSIGHRLRELPELRRARQVLAYLPLHDEPSLLTLLSEVIALGKRVYMPIADEHWTLRYVRWTPADGTQLAAYARWTPSSDEPPASDASIALVPGRAFDRAGYRLGRGKGCYDRSMTELARSGPIVGIAYESQMVKLIPREPHDQPVEIIVTDRETIRLRASRARGSAR